MKPKIVKALKSQKSKEKLLFLAVASLKEKFNKKRRKKWEKAWPSSSPFIEKFVYNEENYLSVPPTQTNKEMNKWVCL